MTILCDTDLKRLMLDGLIEQPDFSMLNPASIDIRVGSTAIIESGYGGFKKIDVPDDGITVHPGQFVLIDTWESFVVPNGYAMDLRLKSSTARKGWDHSLAFWVDPGWRGKLTMEIKNNLQFNFLRLRPCDRFAQIIVHRLSGQSEQPYSGRYNGAVEVEGSKD